MIDRNSIDFSLTQAKKRLNGALRAIDRYESSLHRTDKSALYDAINSLEDDDGCLQEDIHDALRLAQQESPEDWMKLEPKSTVVPPIPVSADEAIALSTLFSSGEYRKWKEQFPTT